MLKLLLLLSSIMLVFAAPSSALEWQGMPEIDPANVTLRPIYLENPRFPSLNDEEKSQFLNQVRELAKQHFDIMVNFDPLQSARIDTYFSPLAKVVPSTRKDVIADFMAGKVDWRRMAESIWPHVYHAPEAVREYVLPHLLHQPPDESPRMLTVALTHTMKGRVEPWTSATALDQHLIIGDVPSLPKLPYNEWIYWDYLGEIDFTYDTVITNQPVISVEYAAIPPHAALRGGLTAGTTSTSAHAKYGAFSWVSTFPFLSADPAVTGMRGGENYTRENAVKYAAALYVHELGHHLFRFGHPWENSNCVMYPVALLQFRSWFEGLDPEKCAIGSSPAMTQGNVRIRKPGQFTE